MLSGINRFALLSKNNNSDTNSDLQSWAQLKLWEILSVFACIFYIMHVYNITFLNLNVIEILKLLIFLFFILLYSVEPLGDIFLYILTLHNLVHELMCLERCFCIFLQNFNPCLNVFAIFPQLLNSLKKHSSVHMNLKAFYRCFMRSESHMCS